MLDDLAGDCRVETLFGVYGSERDAYIARSKIVLNVHYYQAQLLEQPRIAYLLNNRRFVVSEASENDPYPAGLVKAAYERLAESCRRYAALPQEREQIAKQGYDLLRQRPMTEYVEAALTTPAL